MSLSNEQHTIMWWHNFCLAQRIPLAVQDRGDKLIKDDPEYWYTHSMRALWDALPDNVCECGADLRPHEGVCTSCRQAYQSERYVQPRSEFE